MTRNSAKPSSRKAHQVTRKKLKRTRSIEIADNLNGGPAFGTREWVDFVFSTPPFRDITSRSHPSHRQRPFVRESRPDAKSAAERFFRELRTARATNSLPQSTDRTSGPATADRFAGRKKRR
jgi:hypothetical protein